MMGGGETILHRHWELIMWQIEYDFQVFKLSVKDDVIVA